MKIFKKAKRGFTLVELVVVIAVIAILAAVSVGAYFGVTESANKSKLEQESKQFHTAIQTVALRGNADYTLDADGLRVSDIDAFELALEESMGQDVEVLNNDPTYIAKQTIVLKTSELVKSEEGAPVVYKTFEYYTAEIAKKKIIVDVVTGDFTHATSDVVINKDGGDISNDTIYFKSPDWSKWIKIHLGTTDEEVNSEAQTHTLMNPYAPSENIYTFNVSSQFTKVKFSWEKSEQDNTREYTAILDMPSKEANTPYFIYNEEGWKAAPALRNAASNGKTVYFNDPTYTDVYCYAYKWDGTENAAWPGELMERNEERLDKMASYTFKDDYYVVIFNNGNGNGKETQKQYLNTVDFESAPYYDTEAKTFTAIPNDTQPELPATRRVYFANIGWEEICAYAWDDAGAKNHEWPGQLMTEDKEVENLYYIDLLTSYNHIIFNNNNKGSQTDNLDFDGYDAEANKTFYDIETEAWTLVPTEIVIPEINPVNIVGSMNGWNENDSLYQLDEEDGVVYTISLDLKENDEFKFVVSHSWDKELNFNDIKDNDDTVLTKSGTDANKPNIKVLKHGTFTFTLTLSEEKEISYNFVPHVHDYHNEESKCECGDTCKHSEFDSNSICTLCGFVCEPHEWSAGVCGVCGKVCNHETYNENSVCTVCGDGCQHSYVEGTCENCGSSDPDYVPPAVEPYSVYIKGSMNNWGVNEDYKLSYAYEGGYWYKKDVELNANATFKIFYNDGSKDHWLNSMGGEKSSYIDWSGENLKVTKTGTYNIVFSEETEILAVIPSDKVATSVELKGSFDSWANPITFEQSPENEYVYTLDVTWNAKTEFKVILMGQYNGHESLDSTSKALSSGSDWGNIIVNPGSYTISYNFTTGYISIVSK